MARYRGSTNLFPKNPHAIIVRDYQKTRVYRAERQAFNGYPGIGTTYVNIEEAQEWADKITESAWLRFNYPHQAKPIEIKFHKSHKGGAVAYPTRRQIRLHRVVDKLWLVVHEIAHRCR